MAVAEFGMAVYVERPIEDPNWEMVEADVRKILDTNYILTQQRMPDVPWPDEWELRKTEPMPVPLYVRCTGCEGVGIAQGRFAVPCAKCEGSGQEFVGMSKTHVFRQYAWYVAIPE